MVVLLLEFDEPKAISGDLKTDMVCDIHATLPYASFSLLP